MRPNMKKRKRMAGYKILLIVLFLIYLVQYLFDTSMYNPTRIPVVLDIVVFIYLYVSFLFLYRKDNLLCFELMALPVAFLGLFFDDLIYPFSPELSSYFSVGNEALKNKSEDIQMIAIIVLLFGATLGNEYACIKKRKRNDLSDCHAHDREISGIYTYVLVSIIFLLIIYDYVSGTFSTWFYYSNADFMEVEDRNQGLGHLTCLLLATSIIEIIRLRNRNISDLKSFIRKVNKCFIAEWLGISALLFVSGNRNEMLLIMLPMIVGYTVCIKKITNKFLIIAGVTGVLLMAIVGMTRQDGVSLSGGQLDLLSFTRDFADLGYNTDYLIKYTDKYGSTNFRGLFGSLLSGIPFVGSKILQAIAYKGPAASATICTESVVASSGLGTSLIGDLYYTAGLVWVVVYLFIFGYVMSRLYHSDRNLNIYWLVFYSYMVANAVYYVRSSWDFPITVIEYAIIIVLIGKLFFNTRITIPKNK